MSTDLPEDHLLAFNLSAGAEPDLIEPDDIASAFDAWDPAGLEEPEPEPPEHVLSDIEVGASHPTQPWVIASRSDNDSRIHAWVAHGETRAILWEPEGAIHLVWLRSGQEIGLIGETFTPDPTKPAIIGSPLQSEFGYWFECWTWPDPQRISHCPISMRTGWPTALLETPDPHLIFFEWYDQGEAGYEGIILDDVQGDAQDPNESYEIGFPTIGDDLPIVFSPDARYLVRCHAIPYRSQWVSPRPNFLILSGDRSGSWLPPTRISGVEYETLCHNISPDAQQILGACYQPNDNALPPEYCLLPRTAASIDCNQPTARL